ncbi:RsmB/NOP family class I SAM-dependent RNA methyltransferase [Candidatus Lokiarchaeum ossiferum]|uniref:RsmB/NOP family class I SAM-dependent RNA methyltransferase n=1 Tax=Candidatus Lokiarchaeum ossiferum TaxID=2951803 RepID=UPI00352E7F59
MNSKQLSNSLKNTINIIGMEVSQLRSKHLGQDQNQFFKKWEKGAQSEHYRLEIIRNWNKINYLIQKVLRSISPRFNPTTLEHNGLLYYLAYRIHFERISLSKATQEYQISKISLPKRFLHHFIQRIESFNWKIALQSKNEKEKISLKYAIPSFCIDRLLPVLPQSEIQTLFHKMDEMARNGRFTIRINALQLVSNDVNEFIPELERFLHQNKIRFSQDIHYPILYHIPNEFKSRILQGALYKAGQIIIQDKASIAAIKCLDPQPNDLIGDFCAAPGMKTSLIAQFTRNQAQIVATDFHATRLHSLNYLSNKLNLKNTHTIHTDSTQTPFRKVQGKLKFDKILLDAPCTGSGTFTSNPALKWRQNSTFLEQVTNLQQKILSDALECLKPKGILVYSTCSVYPEEGEAQIHRIQDKASCLDIPTWFSPNYRKNGDYILGGGRLQPHIHNTAGFFIAKLQKK